MGSPVVPIPKTASPLAQEPPWHGESRLAFPVHTLHSPAPLQLCPVLPVVICKLRKTQWPSNLLCPRVCFEGSNIPSLFHSSHCLRPSARLCTHSLALAEQLTHQQFLRGPIRGKPGSYQTQLKKIHKPNYKTENNTDAQDRKSSLNPQSYRSVLR